MTKRFYSGARTTGSKLGEAARLKRIEIEKGGKLPFTPTERYRRIMKAKMEESRGAVMLSSKSSFQIPGTKPVERKMSKTTEQAMRLISQRKAMKEEQALRKMVVVQPHVFSDTGRIDKKGNIYDLGNNLTMKVDAKNGTIKTMGGWTIGKYNPRNKFKTHGLITDGLKKHGAYFIQQKKIMMLQEQERLAALAGGSTVWGAGGGSGGLASQQFMDEHYGGAYGSQPAPQQRGSGVNAWGAMSNSVLGTHAENVWGGMVDNVWGGTESNIWGGIGGTAWGDGGAWGRGGRSGGVWGGGGGSIFGGSANWSKRGMIIWGSGNHKSLLKPLRALFAGVPVIGKFIAPKARMRSK